jgi:hypothetical protein
MFFAGLDSSRERLDVHVVDGGGVTVLESVAPPDADGLRGLVERLERFVPVRAAIESMNGRGSCTIAWRRWGGRWRSRTRSG